MGKDAARKAFDQVLLYHERTKHQFDRPARSAGYMDWANQPDPFRFFADCPQVRLPFLRQDPDLAMEGLFSAAQMPAQPLVLTHIAGMIELSMGLSAWKKIPGSTWSLRINPSSGNLHPTESWWLLPEHEQMQGGLFHYNPYGHVLERRADLPPSSPARWRQHFGTDGFFVALSSIFWREAWKYGERAFRYCQHDIGHALATLRFAARLMGWRMSLVHGIGDEDLQRLLGFDRTAWHPGEAEEAEVLCWIGTANAKPHPGPLPAAIIDDLAGQELRGRPEPLSRNRRPWPLIEAVAAACRKPLAGAEPVSLPEFPAAVLPASPCSAAQVIRRRRSAVDFDVRRSHISREHFMGCLQACLPHRNRPPFDLGLGVPQVHLFLFVHYVVDLEPGFYALVRNPDHFQELQACTHPQFAWRQVDEQLPLYLLEAGDGRAAAKLISCNQDIAGDGAFSLGMVARFQETLQAAPYLYKQLFWEAGMIGQVLYLQAEAYGLRGTGIGCFFDDPMHEVCGFRDNRFQSLYHFTIGSPIEDERLTTLPPYHHLSPDG
jgi:SagB-type dehydrogenase family enzyme